MDKQKNKPKTVDRSFVLKFKLIEGGASVLRSFFKWGSFVWIAHYAFEAIKVLAGQETKIDLILNMLGNFTINVGVAWFVAFLASLYGYRQKQLRQDATERLTERITELELKLDPGRSSSKLTTRGETRKEDEHE